MNKYIHARLYLKAGQYLSKPTNKLVLKQHLLALVRGFTKNRFVALLPSVLLVAVGVMDELPVQLLGLQNMFNVPPLGQRRTGKDCEGMLREKPSSAEKLSGKSPP